MLLPLHLLSIFLSRYLLQSNTEEATEDEVKGVDEIENVRPTPSQDTVH